MAQAQVPATRPAGHEGKILILPFTGINTSDNQGWLGRSIQQSLMADLTMSAPGRVVSLDQEAADTPAAIAAGRRADAALVVHGSFTTLNTNAGQGLRIMGEVIDVNSERPVGAFKATGLASEVFRLEDMIGTQIRQRLASSGAITQPMIIVPPSESQPQSNYANNAVQPPNEYYQAYGTPQVYEPPSTSYNYYYSSPAYPAYGWDVGIGWPWWGGAVIIGGDGFHHHGFGHGHFGSVGFGHGGFGGHVGGGMHGGGGVGHGGGHR